MKKIFVAIPLKTKLTGAPTFAVFPMTDTDLDRIQTARELITAHDFSQVRREVFEIDLQRADCEIYTPELVIKDDSCWLSIQWYDFAGGGTVTSEPIVMSDLLETFSESADGQLCLFGEDKSELWRGLSSDPGERWSEKVIGFQVSNPETGEFWEDNPSFVVLTSKESAVRDLKVAHEEDDAWELDTIVLTGVEEPSFA